MKDEVYLKKLGNKIAQFREAKNLSQRGMAKILETSNTQYRRIESGQVNSSINSLRKIATVFGITISELVKV